jgi:predicted methyltransferase
MSLRARALALLVAALLLLPACTSLKRCAYEPADRDEWQKPAEVIAALGLRPGDRVADLGSGAGYFTFRLADAVGPTGKVYATDIDAGMNEDLARRAREDRRQNVEVVLAARDDPRLPEPVDLIFTSNTYHHLEERPAYFRQARRHLRPGGRVAIVEFRPEGFWQWIFPHSTAEEAIRAEMERAGYRLVRELDFLERQSFLIFALPAAPGG